jgi:nucleoredoxin
MNLLARKSIWALILVIVLVGGLLAARNFASASADSTTPAMPPDFAAKLGPNLVVLDNEGKLQPFDASSLAKTKYFAFYHSASWCPPCRVFTPKLVDFYKSFKPTHPDFQLIFVNHDNSAEDMLNYMKADAMPWPAVRYDAIDDSHLNDLDPNEGLPDLILVDAGGKVLSDTFQGTDYIGPEKVLDDIKSMVH